MSKPDVVRRAGIDIGSGMTKLQIADVSVSKGKIVSFVTVLQRNIPFSVVFKEHGTLTDSIIQRGLQAMGEIKTACEEHGVSDDQIFAVGTEVFRRAANGPEYLKLVEQETGIKVRLIEQKLEAMLGYMTGKAKLDMRSGSNNESPIVYDSGGGSFQISALRDDGSLQVYMKDYATAPCLGDLFKIKGVKDDFLTSTPNPVTKEEVLQLVSVVDKQLKSTDDGTEDTSWLKGKTLVGIGSINSIFRWASEFTKKQTYTIEEIEHVVFEVLPGKSDAELTPFYRVEKLMDEPALCVPKLVLLYTVMTHLGIAAIQYEDCVGSCPGILIYPFDK